MVYDPNTPLPGMPGLDRIAQNNPVSVKNLVGGGPSGQIGGGGGEGGGDIMQMILQLLQQYGGGNAVDYMQQHGPSDIKAPSWMPGAETLNRQALPDIASMLGFDPNALPELDQGAMLDQLGGGGGGVGVPGAAAKAKIDALLGRGGAVEGPAPTKVKTVDVGPEKEAPKSKKAAAPKERNARPVGGKRVGPNQGPRVNRAAKGDKGAAPKSSGDKIADKAMKDDSEKAREKKKKKNDYPGRQPERPEDY